MGTTSISPKPNKEKEEVSRFKLTLNQNYAKNQIKGLENQNLYLTAIQAQRIGQRLPKQLPAERCKCRL